jgi:uncharacterized protein
MGYTSKIPIITILIFLVTIPNAFSESSVFNTSFDCGKAISEAEKAICTIQDLANADLEMASIYKNLYSSLAEPQRQQLKNEQLNWLKKRNKCAKEENIAICISNLYQARIRNLKKQINPTSDSKVPPAHVGIKKNPTEYSSTEFDFLIDPKLPPFHFKLLLRKDLNSVYKIEVYKAGQASPFQILDARMDESPYQNAEYFQAEDINFDGYNDVKLLIMWGATGNLIYDYYIFDPTTEKFAFSKPVSDLLNPVPNPTSKELEVYWNGGMAGNVYTRQRFKYEGQKPVLIWQEDQDWDKGKKAFIKTVKERKNNEMTITETQEIPAPEGE